MAEVVITPVLRAGCDRRFVPVIGVSVAQAVGIDPRRIVAVFLALSVVLALEVGGVLRFVLVCSAYATTIAQIDL